MYAAATLAALLAVSHAYAITSSDYQCHEFTVDIAVDNITTVVPPFAPFKDEYEATYLADTLLQRGTTPQPPKTSTLSKSFKINGEWCSPAQPGPKASTLQILTHGIGFNRSYWDFQLPGSDDTQYNYVDAAVKAGYSTLSWNRLGIEPSSLADPYTEIQDLVEVDILASLTKLARAGNMTGYSTAPSKIVHVGHSFGSELTLGLAALYPDLSDGVVITGWALHFDYAPYFFAASSFELANLNQPSRFPADTYSNGYLTWNGKQENQFAFFAYPNFDPAVLIAAEATKYPFAIGEFSSGAIFPAQAAEFKKPVLYAASELDLIACGFNCTGLFDEGSAAYQFFNASPSIENFIHPGVGHALNLHKNATAAYNLINNWVESHVDSE